eukprot:scaffold29654_cov62-Isochrysis_galbana.AAC.1
MLPTRPLDPSRSPLSPHKATGATSSTRSYLGSPPFWTARSRRARGWRGSWRCLYASRISPAADLYSALIYSYPTDPMPKPNA